MRTAHPRRGREPAVFRNLALPVSVFDHIKDEQRRAEAETGERPSINQTVARIVREHRQYSEAREGREHEQAEEHRRAALLR
ncbi:hypothetical protein [Rubrivivax gelatinosus]|uniref:hypothetical protein n=1 Tax=Rubrivivax gelatinosus TaxID=28068 RepID=UPI00130E87E3|nr:hypothetical protein [Rubrivivax gelatinosus]